ncbi:hypothetical protein ACTFIR_011616 [Dictyostelium discoideum]
MMVTTYIECSTKDLFQFVLIEGTGNVSLYVIQISHSPQWERNIIELTNGQGADHVVDVVSGDYFNKAIHQLSRPQGSVISIQLVFKKNPNVDINIYDLIY